jgi:hypothetical protein
MTLTEQKMTEEIKRLKLENELKLRELTGIEVELTAGDFSLDDSDCRRLTFDVPKGVKLPIIRLGDKWAIRPVDNRD